jgi:hypothetical protein
MKEHCLMILMFALACSARAQKCEVSTDPITNATRVIFFDDQNLYDTQYELKAGQVMLTKVITYESAMNVVAPAGSEIVMKLENGEILTLKSAGETAGSVNMMNGINTAFTFIFPVTREQLSKLAASKVVFMRVPSLAGAGTRDIEKKDWNIKKSHEAMMKGAACMLQNL